MKSSVIISLLALTASSVSAFAPSTFGQKACLTKIFSEPEAEEEVGFDLNLEEMFDIFEAADKDKSFDDTIKEVKGE